MFTSSRRKTLILFSFFIVFMPIAYCQQGADNQSNTKPYLGRWDLTLKASDQEYPSWLELTDKKGSLAAQMVGRWGNARPLPKAELNTQQLTFVSPKEEEGS